MKVFFKLFLFLTLSFAIFLAGEKLVKASNGNKLQNQNEIKERLNSTNPGTGIMVQEENQQRTELNNNGSDDQNKLEIQEKVRSEVQENQPDYSPRNENLKGRVDATKKTVENLIQFSYQIKNEALANQIRAIAKAQIKSEDLINSSIDKSLNRSAAAKFFIGPNYKELKNATREMKQNQVRIRELNRIKAQIQNEEEATELQNQISIMEKQNTALGDLLDESTSGFSLFGWLFRWINSY